MSLQVHHPIYDAIPCGTEFYIEATNVDFSIGDGEYKVLIRGRDRASGWDRSAWVQVSLEAFNQHPPGSNWQRKPPVAFCDSHPALWIFEA